MTIQKLYNELDKLIKQGKGNFVVIDNTEGYCELQYIEEGIVYNNDYFRKSFASNEDVQGSYYFTEEEKEEALKNKIGGAINLY
jgi:hypothetical protein